MRSYIDKVSPAPVVPASGLCAPTAPDHQLQVSQLLAGAIHHCGVCGGLVNYFLQQPSKKRKERKKKIQLYHINLLKCCIEPLPPYQHLPPFLQVHHGILWSNKEKTSQAAQCQDLSEVVEQFQDIFSAGPGQAHLI